MNYLEELISIYESKYPEFKINRSCGLHISRIDKYDPGKHTALNLHFEKLDNPDAIYLVNVDTYRSTTPALGKTIDEAIERCLDKLGQQGRLIKFITLRRGVRNRFYYPIVMPLNAEGQGPASDAECTKITFEVWDQELTSHHSFDNLPDAVDKAESMNEEWDKNDSLSPKP